MTPGRSKKGHKKTRSEEREGGGENMNVTKSGNLKPETKHIVCEKCGKEWHFDNAKYCGMCGEKLKETPAKSSL